MFTGNATEGITLTPSGVETPDSILLSIILVLFVFTGLSSPLIKHIATTFATELVSRRQRNIFDTHGNATDTRAILLLLLQTSILEGILLSGWVYTPTAIYSEALTAAILSGAALLFNAFSFIACSTTSYVFTDQHNAMYMRRTLSISQGLLGVTLLIPAAITVLSNEFTTAALITGILLYIIARIIYILKGFSIFYCNTLSILYFILYLCALEIIPVLMAGRIVRLLSTGF